MRRTRMSMLCAIVLAALPARAEAGGLGSVVGTVASAPGTILGGLFGGGGARHHRHHARHGNPKRSIARSTQPTIARDASHATAAEAKGADHGTAAFRASAAASWPSAYEDTFGYVFEPANFGQAFWSRGYADVVDAMFMPNPGNAANKPASNGPPADSLSAPACADSKNFDAVIERIERAVEPDGAQRTALHELGTALRSAAERVAAACGTETPGGPSARLEAMWRYLRALRQAVTIVRTPFGNFYDLLTENQKARLDPAAQESASRQTNNSLRLCGENARMPQWPVRSIAQTIQPTEDQRPMLELLMGASLHSAHELRASCPEAPALTVPARLEAADQRLTGLVYAVTVLRATLSKFSGSLTEEQRTRFDAMAAAPPRPRVELR